MSSARTDPRRQLPAVDAVLQRAEVAALAARFGRTALADAVRTLLAEARDSLAAGDADRAEAAVQAAPERLEAALEAAFAPSLVSVINATGVVVHTNLGRAPLPEAALRRIVDVASGYSNLEFDLASGERGRREVHAETRLRALTGATGIAVVNNNAAAVLLAVNTLAEGRDVVVSRGELVEIGGSFRIPDVLSKAGARLREVGTTNRTRIEDFRSALGPETGLILRVHPSNFKILGYTEAASREALVELARAAGIPFVEDLGSGLLDGAAPLEGEPTVRAALDAGVDAVTFSGDKLLGGPQAGLVAGRHKPVAAMRRNPLYRAVRVDKMTLAALDAVLAEYQAGRATEAIPVQRMLAADPQAIRLRADGFAARLRRDAPGLDVEVIEAWSAVGGGAAPTLGLPTPVVALRVVATGAERLAAALRSGQPPVVGRIESDRVVLDLRTVDAGDDGALEAAVRGALGRV